MKVPADEPKSASGGVPVAHGPGTSGAPSPPAGISAIDMALAEIRLQLGVWQQHEPGARLGADPEELHALRVAVRRIDAVLALFRQQMPESLVRARRIAKGLLRALGAARDFDVQLAELERYCQTLSAVERVAAAPLRTRLEADRGRARLRMIRTLDSEPTRQWLNTLSLASTSHATADNAGAAAAAIVMPERIAKRFRKLRKDVRNLRGKSSMEEYHRVRRRAKLLRYALEPGAALFGKPAQEMLRALRRVQDELGEHQDAQLAKNRLEAIAAEAGAGLPAETLFLMGRLAEHHLNIASQARKTLAGAWKKVRGKRWKSLRARMQQMSAAAHRAQERTPLAVPAPGRPAGAEVAPPEQAPLAPARPQRH
jgi:CHAD domain-containing protein